MTDLENLIRATPLADSHEHLNSEATYLEQGPDVLQDLFDNYILDDLLVAGASEVALKQLVDANDPDLAARWNGIKDAWQRCRFTGYGRAVSLIAQQAYGIDEISLPAIVAASEQYGRRHRPGERLRILRDRGNLDHVQIDDWSWICAPDESGAAFFLTDLSWLTFVNAEPDYALISAEVGVDVVDLTTLHRAMAAIVAKYGPLAVAFKSQHAYDRRLAWQEPDQAVAGRILQKALGGAALSAAEKEHLGDWCWARGVELAIDYDLPFKVHTGYYAGANRMALARTHPGGLEPLLRRYPQARFVLMHTAYPYGAELIALAKHFTNVYLDLCWSWSIDPFSTSHFLRRAIHAVPAHKLFAFGGDTDWPNAVVAYATQARHWLNHALQCEIDDGFLIEAEAMHLASRFMSRNQARCFNLQATRERLKAATAARRPSAALLAAQGPGRDSFDKVPLEQQIDHDDREE